MKISTKLRGSALLIIGIIFVFVGTVLYVSVKAGQAGERNQIAQKILEISVTGATLRVEYDLTGEERPKVQWYALQATFNNILDQAAQVFTEPANQTLFAAIKENQERKKITFDAMVAALEHGSNPELTARLNTQLAVTVQEGVSVATRLAELSREEHGALHQAFNTIVGVLGLFVILFALISYFVSRRISSSLTALQHDFTRIASLDFSSTTTTTTTTGSNDEIGQLARAFSTMIGKLKESYARLEKKVTERTEALVEAKAQDEAILFSIGDAVMACDKDGVVMLFNGAAEVLTGHSMTKVTGHHYNQALKFIRENDGETGDDFIAKAITTGRATKMVNHTLLITKDGQKIPVADSAAPIKNVKGEIIGCVVVFRDVSREREIDRAKSEFVSLASHQLKTPPTAIKLLTERLLGGKIGTLTEKQKEYLNDVHSENQRSIELVNALLNVSRIEMGAFTIQLNEKNICAVVQSVLYELKSVIDKKQLKLEEVHPEKIIMIPIDEALFRMVVNNLIMNAVNYTADHGTIHVECKAVNEGQALGEKFLAENSFVVIVSDTGYGIPKQQQDKLFTKFFRADNAREKHPDGTGLGLYIVKSILDNSGGSIWFNSEENKGTTFYVAIPMAGMKVKLGTKELSADKYNV